jgi:hypothetical protein
MVCSRRDAQCHGGVLCDMPRMSVWIINRDDPSIIGRLSYSSVAKHRSAQFGVIRVPRHEPCDRACHAADGCGYCHPSVTAPTGMVVADARQRHMLPECERP